MTIKLIVFHRKFAPKCSVCQFPIMPEVGQDETLRFVALDRSFHVLCYRCEVSKLSFKMLSLSINNHEKKN